MDRYVLAEHLLQAERAVQLGERHIHRQRQIIEELERNSHPAELARDLLRVFEQSQVLHVADRDRLIREMKDLP